MAGEIGQQGGEWVADQEAVLRRKVQCADAVAVVVGMSDIDRQRLWDKVTRGHREHGDAEIDVDAELGQEALDLVGYAAMRLYQEGVCESRYLEIARVGARILEVLEVLRDGTATSPPAPLHRVERGERHGDGTDRGQGTAPTTAGNGTAGNGDGPSPASRAQGGPASGTTAGDEPPPYKTAMADGGGAQGPGSRRETCETCAYNDGDVAELCRLCNLEGRLYRPRAQGAMEQAGRPLSEDIREAVVLVVDPEARAKIERWVERAEGLEESARRSGVQ